VFIALGVVALGAKLGGKPPANCAGGGADLTSPRGEEICGGFKSRGHFNH